jgi:hypothetical protein
VTLQLREVASPSSPDRPVRFEIPFRGVIRDVDPPQGHMSTVGYLRVSTDQQSLDQQRDALTYGCPKSCTQPVTCTRIPQLMCDLVHDRGCWRRSAWCKLVPKVA